MLKKAKTRKIVMQNAAGPSKQAEIETYLAQNTMKLYYEFNQRDIIVNLANAE